MTNIVQKIKMKCIENGTSLRQLEKDLGFSNGYILTLKYPMANFQRAKAIADTLNMPVSELVGGESDISPAETAEPEKSPEYDASGAFTDDADAENDIRMLFGLNEVGRAEIRGEMRQMLRLKKYNDLLS